MIGVLNIPAMQSANGKQESIRTSGESSYVVTMQNIKKEEYLAYFDALEACGFVKYAENSEGIGQTVFSATFTREDMVLTVAYYALSNEATISFYVGPLSEHLLYDDSYVADNKEGAQTKLYMMELWRFGNSFVFQLKNGHFIISDGGTFVDLPYLLEFLEARVPEGEKPIIEAWFITHAHGDHCGALMAFIDNTEWMKRIYVNGVYYSEPNNWVGIECGGEIQASRMRWVTRWLLATDGGYAKFYRPQTGQRYYFNDITVDVLLCQDQVPQKDYHGDLNTSSTVCMFNVEGQKLFFSGDIHQEGLRFIVKNYTQEYLDLDFFTLNHHGFNTCKEFTEYVSIKTGLLTLQHTLPIRMLRETKELIAKTQETMMWGDGTKVITFPYTIGSYETLPQIEWKYNDISERILQPNIYTFPGRRLKGFIFDADGVIFKDGKLKEGVVELGTYLKENEVHMSAYSITQSTDTLTKALENAGIKDFFELILGADQLDVADPHLDAAHKSEAQFQLDHVHKYVVVCNTYEAVCSLVKDGFRTFVITDGEEIDDEFTLRCWHKRDSLLDFFPFFEVKRILFE